MTKIAIIRHGTTAWNKEGRAQGSSDIPLDPDGLAEAEKLAERLSKDSWDIIISSTLQRAKQTAATIQQKLGAIEWVLDERIREVGGGKTEGTTEIERVALWGENWRDLDLLAEPVDAVIERGTSALKHIITTHPGKNILLVSHGAFIRHVLGKIFPEMTLLEAGLKNTSVTIVTHKEAAWACDLFNCTLHLEEVAI
jgi:probable phosphoglycerate mutase